MAGCALAAALALAIGLTASARGASGRSPRVLCSAGGGRTLARSPRVRVFVRRGVFYSCWLPTRLRTALGRVGEDLPDAGPTLAGHVRIDGAYVAFAMQATGDPGYDLSSVEVVNTKTGRIAREIQPRETESFDSFVLEVGVAANGAVVYLQSEGSPCPGEHHGTGQDGPEPDDAVVAVEPHAHRRTLDCELAIEPAGSITKLAVVGQTATWLHAGVLHTATLR
jgi:hypothetical protein